MKVLRRDAPTCFMHLPKTGGTSIHVALSEALPPGSLTPRRAQHTFLGSFDRFDELAPPIRQLFSVTPAEYAELGGSLAISGHFMLPTLLEVTLPSSIATVVREPRARVLSAYAYWRVPSILAALSPYELGDLALQPLGAFLSDARAAHMIDNQVCRQVMAGDDRVPVDSFIATEHLEALASETVERLSLLAHVGLLERIGDSWEAIGKLFGVTLKPRRELVTGEFGPPTPIGPGDALMSAQIFELIEQRTAIDRLVYDELLARAGLDQGARRRIAEGAFAAQLTRTGDLLGRSASATQAGRDATASRAAHEQTIRELEQTNRELEQTNRELRDGLDATRASFSWRVTEPLRAAKRRLLGKA